MPSALVPTIPLTRRRDLMGRLPTGPSPPAAASAVAALIISLNTLLVGDTFAT
jgi:Mn2+/Fe2+ NRAMP family transporter